LVKGFFNVYTLYIQSIYCI
jgi:hypothetical protein